MADGEVTNIGISLRHKVLNESGYHKMERIEVLLGGWPVGTKVLCYYNFDPDKVPYNLALEKAFEKFTKKWSESFGAGNLSRKAGTQIGILEKIDILKDPA